ncbi:GNAT family N-acetyltransferase [Metabacillus sp. RGM 3146]|uniref:GNAT family N-acetyltransferase n=1 Tax=Metabacillus sp. RGM 3146 TaxID=3401092 RepID=UPI003B9C76A0
MSAIQKDVVLLDFYRSEYESNLIEYYLPPEQQIYTAAPLDAVEKCSTESDRYPVVILHNGTLAGFFVLHGWEGVKEFSTNEKAILLRSYSVNEAFQGKGIANQSMQLLPSFITKHFPEVNEVILAVNHNNHKAQYVYQKGGFEDKKFRAMGKKGEMFIYHMKI